MIVIVRHRLRCGDALVLDCGARLDIARSRSAMRAQKIFLRKKFFRKKVFTNMRQAFILLLLFNVCVRTK